MHPLKLNQDVMPLSEFRSTIASSIEKLQKTLRPMLLTQHGKGVAVVIDVNEFEAMRDKIDLLEGITIAEKQIEEGDFYTQEEMERDFFARYSV